MDTSEIEKHYRPKGQRAYHPKQITSILIYAYSRGVFSSREIEKCFAGQDARMRQARTGISTTEPTAQLPRGGKDNQIMVGQHLSQNANDKKEVEPAIEKILETTGTLPDQLSADHGYLSGDNLEALEASGMDA